MPDRYEPPERVIELTPEQASAFGDPTRDAIMVLLAERPATTTHLAEALGRPKGTVGHHLKVLEELGLIAVVRTRKVRALTEKYYGRLAKTYLFPHFEGAEEGHEPNFLADALHEMRFAEPGEAEMVTIRHARIPDDRALEWQDRIQRLAEEFAGAGGEGMTTYGLVIGVYPTDRPALPADEGDEGDG